MPFTSEDFFVGMIAYFRIDELRRKANIRSQHASRCTKRRPFVCYHVQEGEAFWTPLTGTPHRDRRTVPRRYLRYPRGQFQSGHDLIVGDGRTTFAGPIETFAKLSRRHDEFEGYRRPFLTDEGVAEVQHIVASRRGLMPMEREMALAA